MKIVCELYNYEDRINAANRPRVIVTDGWADRDMVIITIDGKTAKVSANDLRKAIDSCTNLPMN